tara:strand:+ start:42558 stop:46475 length:3918 start_codon:yes stop_codon:yes gene_type:complete
MLSIVPLKNAQAASSYYEKDNYYIQGSNEAIEASHWHGNGAELLGLSGYVELAEFEKILQGKLPNGEQLGRVENGETKHRPGYDLTFSAPKSWSILQEIGGDKRLQTAHDNAVKAALAYLKTSALRTRAFREGEVVFEKVDNFIAALFRHDTSREFDPQTHTHCVVMNAVLRKDGKWRSLSSEALFDTKMTAGVVYRSALAASAKSLGYRIDVTHADGRFELSGVPENVLETFSKRRQEIVSILQEKGWESSKAAETVTQNSRKKKQEMDRTTLREKWQDEINTLEFSPENLIEKAKQSAKGNSHQLNESERTHQAKAAVMHAINHLSEQESIFDEYDIVREALAYGMGNIVLSDATQMIKQTHQKGTLIALGDDRWTTKAAKQLEESNVAQMQAEQGTIDAITTPHVISLFQHESSIAYTEGQISAINLILTTPDRFVGVQGDAGTGKTTMLKGVKALAEEANYTLLGLSATKSAALEMTAKAGIDSITIHKFLLESQHKNPRSYDPSAPLLLIVDESSMIGSRQMNELLKIAKSQNIRVAFVGDIKQLASTQAGNPFYVLQKSGMKYVRMRENLRQKPDSSVRKAVDAAIDGKLEEALRYVRVREEDDKNKRLEKVANEYLDTSAESRKNTLVLIPANKDRLCVNHLIREGLKKKQELQGDEVSSDILIAKHLSQEKSLQAINYTTGDMIEFNRPYKRLHVAAHDICEVMERQVAKNCLIIKTPEGKRVTFNLTQAKAFKPNSFNTYTQEQRQLMAGDVIRWTKNQATSVEHAQLTNGHTADVVSVNETAAQVRLANGQLFDLPLKNTQHRHWDYAFAHTVYAAQGKDKHHVIAHMESYQPKLTHRSAFYTIISRAQFDVSLIVDDRELCVKTLEKHSGQKISVLEALGELPDWREALVNAPTIADVDLPTLTVPKTEAIFTQTQHLTKPTLQHYWDANDIQARLTQHAESVVKRLLGEPNAHLTSGEKLRYGNKGSLSIQLAGQHAGTWHNFETQESGNLIQLIEAQGYNFKEALDYAGSVLGISPDTQPKPPTTLNNVIRVTTRDEPNIDDKKAISKAEKIVLESTDIQGTVAERYLQSHRHIDISPGTQYRYHPGLYESQTKQKLPALIAVARSNKGEIQAVQAIYLDATTGNKADVSINKRTFGRMRFGASVSAGNPKSPHIYIAEGPETALSILSAKPDAHVAAVLSVSNFSKIALPDHVTTITLCLDNDGVDAPANKTVNKAAALLIEKGYTVNTTMPDKIKSDFNDLLKAEGKHALQHQLEKTTRVAREPQKNALVHMLNAHVKKEMTITDREITP